MLSLKAGKNEEHRKNAEAVMKYIQNKCECFIRVSKHRKNMNAQSRCFVTLIKQ